ncbi:hypothetical protein ACP70R_043194 [Stipagrostis hirtigluma subsp. patula]
MRRAQPTRGSASADRASSGVSGSRRRPIPVSSGGGGGGQSSSHESSSVEWDWRGVLRPRVGCPGQWEEGQGSRRRGGRQSPSGGSTDSPAGTGGGEEDEIPPPLMMTTMTTSVEWPLAPAFVAFMACGRGAGYAGMATTPADDSWDVVLRYEDEGRCRFVKWCDPEYTVKVQAAIMALWDVVGDISGLWS